MTSLNYTFSSVDNTIKNIHSNGFTVTDVNINTNNNNNNYHSNNNSSKNNNITSNNNNKSIFGSKKTLLRPILDDTTPRTSAGLPSVSFDTVATSTINNTTNLNGNSIPLNTYNHSSIPNPNYYRSSLQFYFTNPNSNTNINTNASSYQQSQLRQYSYSPSCLPKLNSSNTRSLQTDDTFNNNTYALPVRNGVSTWSSLLYKYKTPLVHNTQYQCQNNEYNTTTNDITSNSSSPNNNGKSTTPTNNNNTRDTKFIFLLNNQILRNNNNYGNSPFLQPSQDQQPLSISSLPFNQTNRINNNCPQPSLPPLLTPKIKTDLSNQYYTGHSLSLSGLTTVSSSNLSALSARFPDSSSSSAPSTLPYQQNHHILNSQPVTLRSVSIGSNTSTTLNEGFTIPPIIKPRYSFSSSYSPATKGITPFLTPIDSATVTNTKNNNTEYYTTNLNPILNSELSPKSTCASLNSGNPTQNYGVIQEQKRVKNTNNNNNDIVLATNEVEVYYHKCNKCNKSFKRKSWLMRHLLSHSTERHFFCQWCLSRHKRKDNLLQHMKQKHPKLVYQELKSANVLFKWHNNKNINFANIPEDKRIDYVDSIKNLIQQGIISKEDVKRVLNKIIKRNYENKILGNTSTDTVTATTTTTTIPENNNNANS